MDSLFLLQFACFIFMLVNAFFVAVSHLHVRWENKRYERSRWMIVVAMIGLAMQYLIQMAFGFRAADDSLGCYYQYPYLYALLLSYLFRYLQHRDYPYQSQKDDSDVQWHLCCHHCGLLRGYQSSSKPVYPRGALSDADSVLRKCFLLHIHDYSGDD